MTARHHDWARFLLVAAAMHASVARAEAVVRKTADTDDGLMARVLGESAQLAQKVVRSSEILPGKVVLIGFVNAPDNSLVGHLLVETAPTRYEHVTFPSCEEEGGAPELLAVFFARTVKGGGRDLAVLCRWESNGGMVNGMSYGAQFYRVDAAGAKPVVTSLTQLNQKFETDDLVRVNNHGKWTKGSKPAFKTVADVKKLLTKMGIPQ
ncbi:MAG: hypothetical protein ABUS79_13210 [Pseudomonadota bacterium]